VFFAKLPLGAVHVAPILVRVLVLVLVRVLVLVLVRVLVLVHLASLHPYWSNPH
jgi:hypothetical protein